MKARSRHLKTCFLYFWKTSTAFLAAASFCASACSTAADHSWNSPFFLSCCPSMVACILKPTGANPFIFLFWTSSIRTALHCMSLMSACLSSAVLLTLAGYQQSVCSASVVVVHKATSTILLYKHKYLVHTLAWHLLQAWGNAYLELLCSNAHFVFNVCPAVYQAGDLAQLAPLCISLHHVPKQCLNALSTIEVI